MANEFDSSIQSCRSLGPIEYECLELVESGHLVPPICLWNTRCFSRTECSGLVVIDIGHGRATIGSTVILVELKLTHCLLVLIWFCFICLSVYRISFSLSFIAFLCTIEKAPNQSFPCPPRCCSLLVFFPFYFLLIYSWKYYSFQYFPLVFAFYLWLGRFASFSFNIVLFLNNKTYLYISIHRNKQQKNVSSVSSNRPLLSFLLIRGRVRGTKRTPTSCPFDQLDLLCESQRPSFPTRTGDEREDADATLSHVWGVP